MIDNLTTANAVRRSARRRTRPSPAPRDEGDPVHCDSALSYLQFTGTLPATVPFDAGWRS